MNWIDEISQQHAKKLAQDIDEAIINFLKSNGYRPRHSKKYAQYIQDKLKRKGLTINVEKIVLEEKFENGIYKERYAIKCNFVPLKQKQS